MECGNAQGWRLSVSGARVSCLTCQEYNELAVKVAAVNKILDEADEHSLIGVARLREVMET